MNDRNSYPAKHDGEQREALRTDTHQRRAQ